VDVAVDVDLLHVTDIGGNGRFGVRVLAEARADKIETVSEVA
jgi:hypothetical protein